MTVRLRLLASLLALLVPAGMLGRATLARSSAGRTAASISLPARIGPWTLTEDQQLGADILQTIAPDAYLLRLYEAPGRAPIWAYVGFYAGRADHASSAHDPEVCYPAQGWEILDSGALSVPLDHGEKLQARSMRTHQGNREQHVLYWFQPAGRWPARSAAEELLRLLDAVAGRPQYAFVRLSARSEGDPSTMRDLEEFASKAAPPIRRTVEEAGEL